MQGVITAPMLYAMEEFPQLQEVVDRGFDNPANIEIVSSYFRLWAGFIFHCSFTYKIQFLLVQCNMLFI